MSVRQFTLINGSGETYDLMSTAHFLHDVSGLGFDRDDKYRQIGDRFLLVSTKPKQGSIPAILNLTPPDAYIKYQEFMNFISITPLTLAYIPVDRWDYYKHRGILIPETIKYYRSVRLSKAEKKELEKYGSLEISIDLVPLGPWYRNISVSTTLNEDHGDALTWPLKWPILWEQDYGRTIKLISDSYTDSPCRLVITGPAVNPEWQHYADGKLTATGKLNRTIYSGQKLVVDNINYPFQIALYQADGEFAANVYQYSDFSTKRFLMLKHGENSIHVSEDENRDVIFQVDSRLSYESV